MLTRAQLKAKGYTDLAIDQAIEATLCSRSLEEYAKAAWVFVEPAAPMVWGWHLSAIADHLSAVSSGQIRDLLINMPPRHTKSLTVSVFWPTWQWTHTPSTRWLYSSYAQSLSTRDALASRRLLDSPWYRQRWGHVFKLTTDQNTKTRYDNDKSGYRIASAVDASNTGEGGDIVVVDDPHNVNEAESEVVRKGTVDWWTGTMSTRFNDPKTGRRVIVMQRVHEADLSGHVLEQGGYEHLCLPAEYEPGRSSVTVLGNYEQRKEAGELLHPDRFGPKEIAKLKKDLGSYKAAGQLQQRPSPAEGGIIKRNWWRMYQGRPLRLDAVLFSWDATFKDAKTSDYVVGQVWGRKGTKLYLLDQVRDRMDFPATLKAIVTLRAKWLAKEELLEDPDYVIRTLIEDTANGPAIIASLRNKVPAVIPVKVKAGKAARLQAVAALIEAGDVHLPETAGFTHDLIEEAASFPMGEHDDQLDALSQALAHLQPGVWRPEEKKADPPKTLEDLRTQQFWQSNEVPAEEPIPERLRYLNGG